MFQFRKRSEEVTTTAVFDPAAASQIEAAPQTLSLDREAHLRLAESGRRTPAADLRQVAVVVGILGLSYYPAIELIMWLSGVRTFGEPAFPGLWLALIALLIRGAGQTRRIELLNAALTLSGDNKRWIGPLIDAMSWPNRRIRAVAQVRLLQLLPSLTFDETDSVTPRRRETLHEILMTGMDEAACITIIKAMEKIGDERSVKIVTSIAERSCWTLKDQRLRSAARISLPLIQDNVRRMHVQAACIVTETAKEYSGSFETETSSARWDVPARMDSIEAEENAKAKSYLERLEEAGRRRARPGMRFVYLAADWAIIVPYTGWQAAASLGSHLWAASAAWTVCCGLATQLHRLALSPRQSEEARKLAMLSDIQVVGTFAEALEWPDEDMQLIAEQKLITLLPRLKASDAGLLNTYQRGCIYRVLKPAQARKHEALTTAILGALEQVGDPEAIGFVERLAAGKATTGAGRRIQAAAIECLPALQAMAPQTRASQQLLRPSSELERGGDSLVRPVTQPPHVLPEELLRAEYGQKPGG